MHIGIDARMYGSKQGGLGRYIEQLILHLEKIATTHTFSIFLTKQNWNDFQPKTKNFKKVFADIPWYTIQEQVLLPRILKKSGVDLMHFPHWNIPLLYKKSFVVTIHDLLLTHHPSRTASLLGPLKYYVKYRGYLKTLQHIKHYAKHIFTVSEYSKLDIHKTLSVPLDAITVTYLAPFTCNKKTPLSSEEILKKYSITKPYILYVGVAFPHKNLSGLLQAFTKYQTIYKNFTIQLILVGKKNYFYEQLLPLIKKNKSVVYTDFIPDEELEIMYKNSSLYVMPSLYEGSALPCLEALQYNLPVICSERTCLPEILQNAAYYFNPEKIDSFVKAIFTGLTDTEIRNKLIQAGQKVYSSYSWDEVAKKTLAMYTQFKN